MFQTIRCSSCRMPLKQGEPMKVIVGNDTLHAGCLERYLVKANIALRKENRRLRLELQAAVKPASHPTDGIV